MNIDLITELGIVILESFVVLLPLLIIFIIMQLFFLKLKTRQLIIMIKGIILTFLGLVLFLFGIKISFINAGSLLGTAIGTLANYWVMVPIAFLLGFIVTLAEPAVKILTDEIERLTTGYIKPYLFVCFLASGVGFSVALAIIRIIKGIPLGPFILTGYLIVLFLMRFANPLFVAIAFDAGGVAVGPLVTAFLLAITTSYGQAINHSQIIIDSFGTLALVAVAPIIMVLLLGCLYERNQREVY